MAKFSDWKRWADRTSLDADYPGVYLLAHFDITPEGPADPLASEIIYIGETCGPLQRRLRQFHRSAFKAKEGHAGGKTYRCRFGGDGRLLHIAVRAAREVDHAIRPFFIRYLERKLIWQYASKWGEPPACNRM